MTAADAIRWSLKPSYSLQAAASCRELADVRPVITPWGNAMRLQLDHDAEVALIERQGFQAVERRQAVRS
jgi:hypothetical protein